MASGSINEEAGLFGADSMIWRINRESVVTLSGTCAVLMQFAHPKVAAGVRDHSQFRIDPTGRLRRTLDLMQLLAFGSHRMAMEAARTINRRHQSVVGPDYTARDPELLIWVQATLVYSSIRAYRFFVGPLSRDEANHYYQDTQEIGVLLGIPRRMYPPDIEEFDAYVDSMIESGHVTVGEAARGMGWVILQPHFPGVPRMAFTPLRTITAALLPAALREQYGLRWGRRQRLAFAVCRQVLPRAVSLAPPAIRFLPHALQAYRRLRDQQLRASAA